MVCITLDKSLNECSVSLPELENTLKSNLVCKRPQAQLDIMGADLTKMNY